MGKMIHSRSHSSFMLFGGQERERVKTSGTGAALFVDGGEMKVGRAGD